MTEKSQRFEEILRQTRISFLQDSQEKMQEIRIFSDQRRDDPRFPELFAETVHKRVHAMKGLALTLSYTLLDELCNKTIHYILQHENPAWSASDMEQLDSFVAQIRQCLDEIRLD